MEELEELLDKAIQNDIDALEKILQSINIDLYRVANAKLEDEEDIKDAISETTIEVYNNLHKLKEKSYFKTWVIKILINKCNDIYKSKNRQLKIFTKFLNSRNFEVVRNHTDKVDEKLDFESLLRVLNYDEKIVIVLHYNNRYTVGEIADILNTNVNTIKSRLTRGKQKIEKYVKEVKENGSRK